MAENILIIGAVAVGPKSACRFKRLCQNGNVTIIDQDDMISYGGCGIPYYISGDVSDESELRSTSFHMVRDERFFRDDKGVTALTGTKALNIDRRNKTVRIRENNGNEKDLSYDKLVIGVGTRPRELNIPGTGLKNVYRVGNLHDAIQIKEKITAGQVKKAVVIGGGFIGLEMAEALADMWQIETTVVEFCDQIMPGFVSKSLALMARKRMEAEGVAFYLGECVEALEGAEAVERVRTNQRTLEADLVIMAVGVAPNTQLAADAGLEIGPNGFIVVNDHMQTSDPDIYAGGDCVQITNLVTGKPGFFPLGSMANRQGRVIGTNLAGGNAVFPGGVGSFVVKTFDMALAGAGLSDETARKQGFDAVGIQVSQFDRAHFYPEKEIIYLELVVDRKTRRVLGIQGFGGQNSGMFARVNAVATILQYHPTVEAVSNLEIAYSPPFASAMDIVNALGNAAENFLDGRYAPMTFEEFEACWQHRGQNDCLFLDCRAYGDAKVFEAKYPESWKSIPHNELMQRMDEVPRDKKLILVCNTGVRSYEAQINLRAKGFDDTVSVGAGVASLKQCGMNFETE
ncbi:MAG: FAD-dependent oxidoreductase [Desulfobacterales bacterium]|jgi:NADPH-dependent 2,4-dienoyl-CoA reductase/sulfur reductase-like enzyme/rhodanese-related sulfurtransferase|nr:FAD-dependent oxidoreductase [Desulfobacterales bacterium]